MGGLFGGGKKSGFIDRAKELVGPEMPTAPDNDPAAQATIAEAARREREEEARKKGRASTILAGEQAGVLSTARRSLLGA